jgi:hypothetical protein
MVHWKVKTTYVPQAQMDSTVSKGPALGQIRPANTQSRTVGLLSTTERLDLAGQSGSLTFDSFHVRSAPTTEASGQKGIDVS